MTHPDVSRLRRSLNGEKLAIGVDRLDYSKGLVNRIKAFDRMWTLQPQLSRTVSLLQIATPSRGAIEAYGNLQNELAKLVSDVNGRHGEVDWTPIRYLNKGYSQTVLAGLYRTAQVGVVTPLQDGMNLVAKEYVAAQNPADPGVLVLSKFAGAANELDTALLVNPHDIDGMARTIATALSMPLIERRMRWEAMMAKLRATPSSNGSPISSTRCRTASSKRALWDRSWLTPRPCGRCVQSITARGIIRVSAPRVLYSVILRCERSEPRRMNRPQPGRRASRRASARALSMTAFPSGASSPQ